MAGESSLARNPFETAEVLAQPDVQSAYDAGMACVYPEGADMKKLSTSLNHADGKRYHTTAPVQLDVGGESRYYCLASPSNGDRDGERRLLVISGILGQGGVVVGNFEVSKGRLQYFYSEGDSRLNDPDQLRLVSNIIQAISSQTIDTAEQDSKTAKERRIAKEQKRKDRRARISVARETVTTVFTSSLLFLSGVGVVGGVGVGGYFGYRGIKDMATHTEQFDEHHYDLKGQTISLGDDDVEIISNIDDQPELELAPYFTEFSFTTDSPAEKTLEDVVITDVISSGELRSIRLDDSGMYVSSTDDKSGYVYVFMPKPSSETSEYYLSDLQLSTSGNLEAIASMYFGELTVETTQSGTYYYYGEKAQAEHPDSDTVDVVVLRIKVGQNTNPEGSKRSIFIQLN